MSMPYALEHMTSDSDDESFVVLSSSIPPESMVEIRQKDIDELDKAPVQESIETAKEMLSDLSAKSMVDKLPSLPKVEPLPSIGSADAIIPDTTSSLKSNISDCSQSEIQQRVENLIEENAKLKDALVQNHLTLKKQYDTIAMWNEDVQKVHEIHKQKFAETKAYVEKLKLENSKLKEGLQVAETTISCLREELDSIKSQDPNIKLLNEELYKCTVDNINKFEQNTTQEKIAELNEIIKKRDQTEAEMNAEIMKLKEEIKALTDENRSIQMRNQFENLNVKEDVLKAEIEKLKIDKEELNRQINEDHKTSVLKQSKLIEEIDALRNTLTLKTNTSKENMDKMQEQLMLSQIQLTGLQEERKKDQDLLAQKEKELNDCKKELQAVQARAADVSALIEKDKKIQQLEQALLEMKAEVEMVPVIKEQLNIYKADFEAEREAKNALKSQKDNVVEDLGNLQRRNQQLLEEVETLRSLRENNPELMRSLTSGASSQATAPQQEKFACPKCSFAFYNYQALVNHVERCLDLDVLP